MIRRRLIVIGFALAGATAGGSGLAEQAQIPARPASSSAVGVIDGLVSTAAAGRPIRAVRVTLDGATAETTESGAAVSRPLSRITFTDPSGRFVFADVPTGRYLVVAEREQYLSTNYGQKRPGGAGAPIDLAAKQHVSLQIAMTRGSAIAGTVLDENGEPLVRARVRALRYLINANGVKRLRQVGEALTDDRGMYRLSYLEPGDYLVSAGASTTDVGDQRVTVVSVDDDAAASLDAGASAGAGLLQGPDGAARVKPPVVAPIFYPASLSAAGARSVTVDGFDEHSSIDIRVRPVFAGSIEGRVLGRPESAVTVQVLLHNTDAAEEPTSLTGNVDPDGRFTLSDVPPGQYLVYAQTLPSAAASVPAAAAGAISTVQAVRMTSFDRLHGRAPVTVEGGRPAPVTITLQPGRSISGHIVLDLSQPPLPNAPKTTISITPAPQLTGLPAFNTSPQVMVDADGNFTLPGIRPGRYLLRASGPGVVASVMFNGQNTLDVPLELTPDADVSGVVMTLTDRVTELSGLVTDAAGKPGGGTTVIVLPTDRRYWTFGSRRIVTAKANADGRYAVRGLPPGEYRIAAILDFDPVTQFELSYLDTVVGTATPIVIGTAERKTLDLLVRR